MKKGISFLCIISIILFMFFSPLVNNRAEASSPSSLRVGWTTEPDSLSPFISNRVSTFELHLLIYDSLVAFDNHLKPEGRLAESWNVSDDNLTWTFKLKKGVKWHDGVPFTSQDVKYSYETLLKAEMGMYSDFLKGITSIETPDDYTVVIKTDKPKANMLYVTAPILPKHIWEKVKFDDLKTWPNEKPIGTGAFKFVEWKKGEYVKLEANKDYFLGTPKVNELIYPLYANNDTMVQSLKIGEIDAAININANQVKLLGAEKNMKVLSNPTNSFTNIGINSSKDKASKGNPLLLNTSIKQAMEYAIDKQKIIDVAYSGQGKAGTTIVPTFLKDWHNELSADKVRSFDANKAKAILDDAGFKDQNGDGIREDKNGKPLEFRLYTRSKSAEEVKAGQMVHSMLNDVGIETKVETMDDGVLGDKIADKGNYDLFIWGWTTDIDPTTILSIVSTDQIGNLSETYYSNSKYDELLAEQATTIDFKKRQSMVYEMQDILAEDLPYIILMEENAIQAVRTDKWKGWTPVQGAYFMTANNYNYLHVEPAVKETASGKDTNKNNENSSNSWWIYVAIAVAIIVLILVVKARKRNGIDRFDDM
ncbi:ABC transporter substrate-binding protein [Neobacillus sp. PS3-34]|uniref:ABC transporter substrate-binding protein n=1 Tax=Neobacillus sp. PS3-34 TaxID=3070678 RepID=UPI0027DF5439|nr:ABC transporter substrate-binding protein [Neobacillus sp. PS3-34]WML48454.1 ABC transporter substrate-binding protein [Neobacillus sp. PS3-34]